ncbi:MAG: aminotransferase class I/II-fold pyridoxal phosphate-dependent enzyme [Clostridia bacterium]|nr:aminotransferase class I/II-fold pyridoxal phosphate-dependent enzyme [Clostridia bacterium]
MVSFESDYIAGAHPAVLQRLIETNAEPLSGYGTDVYSSRAREKIRVACAQPEAQVEFLTGGTQTNAVVISTLLGEWEGVLAANTAHIATHEAGAIEYAGRKVMELPHRYGKISAADVRAYAENYYADANREHIVRPGMVYITYPTEYGTLYTKQELCALADVCRAYDMLLYLDGARLGFGLESRESDLSLADLAAVCDVFTIGGTKVGLLCGEAVVFRKGRKPAHYPARVKQRGALLAKGRLLGVQFDALFTDDLYFRISRHVLAMAEEMEEIFREAGCPFFLHSPTNQKFVVFGDERLARLREKVAFGFWEKPDSRHTVIRAATGWSTMSADLQALREALR